MSDPRGDGQADTIAAGVVDSRGAGLAAGTIGTFAVTMQSIGFVGPAFSALLLFQVIAGYSGVSVAFSFLIAGAIILMLAASLATLAARLPSAGGYVTYITRAAGARSGFLMNWIFVVYVAIAPGFIVTYAGYVCEQALKAQYGFALPWWIVLVSVLTVATAVVFLGIRPSARAMIALGLAEATLVLALAMWGLASPGRGGFTLSPLSPAAAPGLHGVYLGVIFSLLAFAGWEGAVPLAEESRRPGRSVPIGLVAAVLSIVALFVVANWGLMVGWGTHALPSLLRSQQAPPIVLAHRYWGGAWVLVLVALLNSVICATIASFNAVTRMWYAVARAGLGPARLAALHPRHRTPTWAVALQGVLALGIGLGFGLWLGPLDAFLTLGLLSTLALVAVYVAGNMAVIAFHVRETHAVKPLLHVVFPILTSVAVIWVGYKSLQPLPPPPVRWGVVAAGAWLLLGIALLLTQDQDQRRKWASDARLAIHERSRHAIRQASAAPDQPLG